MDQRTSDIISTSIAALSRKHAIERYRSSLPTVHDVIYYLQIIMELYFVKHPEIIESIQTTLHLLTDTQNDFQKNTSPMGASLSLTNLEEMMNIHMFTTDYDSYCTARDNLLVNLSSSSSSTSSAFFTRLLTAQTFCKLPRDIDSTLSLFTLTHYLRIKIELYHIYTRLLSYDIVGDGYLREHELENYIFEAIPNIPELVTLQENFYPFYVFTAVRKFFFFLDGNKMGKIAIKDIIASKIFAEWMRILPLEHPDLGYQSITSDIISSSADNSSVAPIPSLPPPYPFFNNPNLGFASLLTNISKQSPTNNNSSSIVSSYIDNLSANELSLKIAEQITKVCYLERKNTTTTTHSSVGSLTTSPSSNNGSSPTSSLTGSNNNATNWFSANNALRIYSQYLMLDIDQNGMLNADELARYRGGILTNACITRIYEECHTYTGEIDFKVYLDIILALENRLSKASQKFLFRLLDIHHKSKLTLSEIRYFVKDITQKLILTGHDAVDDANVCDEIFDMIHPKTPNYITLDDILKCKVGHTVCSILLDVAAFYTYDRREELKGETEKENSGEIDSDFED